MQTLKHSRALALLAGLTTACGQLSLPANMNLDPNQTNTLSIDTGFEVLVFPLVGGTDGRVAIDTNQVLSLDGLRTSIIADRTRVAGESVDFLGRFPTGTVCVREDLDDPTTTDAVVRYPKGSKADVHFAGEASSEFISQLLQGGTLPLVADAMDVPLQINWLRLYLGQLEGTIRASVIVEDLVPADSPLFAGAPFRLELNLASSLHPARDALLAECTDFFEGP